MPEYVPRVPLRLDPLQARVVVLVIQRGPRHAGRVPRRISEVGVRVVDQRAIVRAAGNRNAAGLARAFEGQPLFGARIGP